MDNRQERMTYMNPRQAVLSAVVCDSYRPETVRRAIIEVLGHLGGLSAFVKPSQTVLLKPNLLAAREPENAVTTHPIVVETVSSLCRELGAKVLIGDSPPVAIGKIEEYWEITGMITAAGRSGASLLALEKEPRREITVQGPHGPLRIHVTEWLYKADVVINLPKMKTHNLTVLTGAVKNHYGLLPGVQKAQFHLRFPKPRDFGRLVAEIYASAPTRLTLMDAVEGMDGSGPASGRVIKPGCFLASSDAVAVDLAFASIAGLDPATLPVFDRCRERNIGPSSISEVSLRGEPLERLRFNDFQAPATAFFLKFVPDSMVRVGQKLLWARPAIVDAKCIKCGACVRVCPAKAVSMAETAMFINRGRCISCFCCMEVCPKNAIELQSSALISMGLAARRAKNFLQGRKS